MDKALKQRLVGASVLIALAVIVLPMLLSGKPQDTSQQTQKIELPPRPEELSFETRRFPVTDPQEDKRPAQGQQPPADAKTVDILPDKRIGGKDSPEPTLDVDETAGGGDSLQSTVETPPPAIASQDPVADDKPVPQAVSPSAPASAPQHTEAGRYLVQVASLSSSGNASRLAASLQEKNFPVLIDTVDSDVGRLNRVRVGPFEKESEAMQVSTRIGKEFAGVSPRVVDLLPDQSSAVTSPADSLVRWVVQVGSFSDADNAERLTGQIKAEGMSAYRETVTSSSSSIFRVRVGPFLEREEAIRTRQLLADRLSIEGVVMSAD